MKELFRTSRDWDDLVWAWKGWRDATGKHMKQDYEDHVVLMNKKAKLSGTSLFYWVFFLTLCQDSDNGRSSLEKFP